MALIINGTTWGDGEPVEIGGVTPDSIVCNGVVVWVNTTEVVLPQFSATWTLRDWLNANHPGVTALKVINNLTQPSMNSGNLSGLSVELVNNGEIQGTSSGSYAMGVTSAMKLTNNGWIRGAGGNGGVGGNGGLGGTGGKGANSSAWVDGPSYFEVDVSTCPRPANTAYAFQIVSPPLYSWTFIRDGVNLCDHENSNPLVYDVDATTKVYRGAHRTDWFAGDLYEVYLSKATNYTGGAGGNGGAGGTAFGTGGNGQSFSGPRSDGVAGGGGSVGLTGNPSTPAGGNAGGTGGTGGKKGDGGNGGTWGEDGSVAASGSIGEQGWPGAGGGDLGATGSAGSLPIAPISGGNAITGSSFLVSGSNIGDTDGDVT